MIDQGHHVRRMTNVMNDKVTTIFPVPDSLVGLVDNHGRMLGTKISSLNFVPIGLWSL